MVRMSIALPQIPIAESIEPLPGVAVDALYVHVPFCFHKCHYCDFYSITRQSPERMAAYVDRILREADQWSTRFTATPISPEDDLLRRWHAELVADRSNATI